jgi:isoleucyl-tRNA synthetase
MQVNIPKLEEKILEFWKKNRIFEKSIKQRAKAPNFVFYEGPPTANAKPGIHHVLARSFKDIICRYKTMKGFRVLRKAGWDTHGLPVELEIEKKLGLKKKKDIEKYGISKFNKKCKKSVWEYKKDWEQLTERIGFWLDMENPYITYTPEYIESVWWIIKQIWKLGLLYKDYKVVPYCPRCGTPLSSHEVAQGYKRIKEPAIYVKFKIRDQRLETRNKNTYLLVWTTTPWTLPGNVAIAVNPQFNYVKVKVGNENLILAKKRMKACGVEGKITQEFKGKDLLNLKYEPLFPTRPGLVDNKAYFVVRADFVSLEEGTGLVHIAPAFGEEDMEAGKENNLPLILNVDEEGKFKKEVKEWAGMFVKDADPLIIEDLKKRNLLFKKELYEHDYPFCWRCKSPLLYYAKESWFINMQKVKKKLIENNKKINWIPAHLKEGRFGEWLKEVKDWALSRERYWGTPLPIWECKKCSSKVVVGSKKELLSQKYSTNKYFILRHGKVQKEKGIIYDWPSLSTFPLSKKGREEIVKIAKKLKKEKIDVIFASDALRTKQTAEIVAKELGLKVNFDSRLRDINLGVYQGRQDKEFYRDFPPTLERFQKRPKDGENWTDVKKRILSFIRNIEQKYKNKKILIVSHGDPLWILEGMMKGQSNEELLKERIKNGVMKKAELRKFEFKDLPYNENGNLDFHRPYIDRVKFICQKCGSRMERVKEVLDCWFDSGSMPFAQWHWPFENKKIFKEQFPADFIAEGIDQTRGWFYTLLAISTLLGFGPSYKNVISLGHVLDEKGEKMSKSKGNVVSPWEMVEKYGADSLRWYFFTVNQPGDSKLFSERELADSLKKFILTFLNCAIFLETYGTKFKIQKPKSKNILDKWIVSKLNEVILRVTKSLDDYDVTTAARIIEDFVIEDFSQWYIRRSRKRFQKPETKIELKKASETLKYVLFVLCKLAAPFVPFLSEQIYQKLKTQNSRVKSIHLEDWPKVEKRLIDTALTQKMSFVRKIVSLGLRARARAKIKVRQPLSRLQIQDPRFKIKNDKLRNELLKLIKEELNVKEIELVKNIKKKKDWIIEKENGLKVALDIKIIPELKREGQIREIIRQIQALRKNAGLKPKDKIIIWCFGTPILNHILLEEKEAILKEVKAKGLKLTKKSPTLLLLQREVQINRERLWVGIQKI